MLSADVMSRTKRERESEPIREVQIELPDEQLFDLLITAGVVKLPDTLQHSRSAKQRQTEEGGPRNTGSDVRHAS